MATRVLSGNAAEGEETRLRELVQSNPEFQVLYDQYARYWQSGQETAAPTVEAALERAWQKIHAGETPAGESPADVPVVPIRRINKWYWVAAATVAGLLLVAGWLMQARQSALPEMLVSYNPRGVRSTIALPDGSKVWLSGDSRLEYPAAFTGNLRELKLEGEAFFDVFKNKEKPFVIHLQSGDVRVLGTSFNIESYAADEAITTSVATGKVAFVPAARAYRDSIFLTPGLKVTYTPGNDQVSVTATNAAADRAWTEGILVFAAEELSAITRKLERFYGRKIVFRDEKFRRFRYTGTFSNSSAEEILHFLSRTKAFPITISDTAILIGK
ncbi:FecR family protein [Flavihumibacter petaseus]|uniref:FecR family protein n=1 Tax=Flavihumibacter petaseus TaxID=549295 RepID=UPI00061CFA1C|nr:FecR domain-containing protein [Flavihumibacter petaseus]